MNSLLPTDVISINLSHPFYWRRPASISLKQRCVLEYHPKVRWCEPSGPRPLNNPHLSAARTNSHLSLIRKPSEEKGENQKQRISVNRVEQQSNNSQNTMQAVLQISAGVPYPAPSKTSRQRYCLVWISSVKWWCYSQKQEVNSLTNPTRKCHQFIFTYHPASVAQICNFDQHVGPDFSDGIWSLVQQRPLIWNRRCATHSAFIWKEKKQIKHKYANKMNQVIIYWSNCRCRSDYPEG